MRAGKIASIILVLFVTAVTGAVHLLEVALPESIGTGGHMLFAAAAVLVGGAAVFIPIGFLFDRSLMQLSRAIVLQSTDGTGRGSISTGWRWLAPVTRALTGAVDQFRVREQQLRAQLNELEIRHRVGEHERRQIDAALNALHDGVIVTDPFNEIIVVNDSAARILGFERDKALHRSIEEIIRDERIRRMIRDTRAASQFNHARHEELEFTSHTGPSNAGAGSDGTLVFDVGSAAIPNHKQEVGGVVTILHDLTRIREISQMKSDFVSKASHELRTPLSSIRAYVEMLVDGEAADDRARQEFYRIMQGETDRLGRLIDNMLNISRIEAGIVQIQREHVDFKRLIERAIHTITPQAEAKGIAIHWRVPGVDVSVEGDADMLYQVVLNLLSNAVKYTPGNEKIVSGPLTDCSGSGSADNSQLTTDHSPKAGNRITLTADTDNLTRSVVVSVSDTGLGIPPDSLPKLFDKFFRVENYKRVAKGTGLGLNLCKHIVETVHHGSIGVESKLGMGSKFWFSVPMRYAGGGNRSEGRGQTPDAKGQKSEGRSHKLAA